MIGSRNSSKPQNHDNSEKDKKIGRKLICMLKEKKLYTNQGREKNPILSIT